MKTFILTNEQIPGTIYLHEDECGRVRCNFSESDATASQQSFLLKTAEGGIEAVRSALTFNSCLTEIKATFDDFWNRYDDKQNSSRKRAQAKWDKMSPSERQKAYNHVAKYFANLPHGIRKKYAEKYLNDELWNN